MNYLPSLCRSCSSSAHAHMVLLRPRCTLRPRANAPTRSSAHALTIMTETVVEKKKKKLIYKSPNRSRASGACTRD
jgi:hypothetical protein